MKNTRNLPLLALIALVTTLALASGCQTVAGFGRDLEAAANAVQRSAR